MDESSMECETSSQRWTHLACIALLDVYKVYENINLHSSQKWPAIAAKVSQKGFNFTPRQCEFKVKNLKKAYLKKKSEHEPYPYASYFQEDRNVGNTGVQIYEEDLESVNHKFTSKAIVAMLEARKKNNAAFKTSSMNSLARWKLVEEDLKKQGLNYNARQCEFKFKGMKRKYLAEKRVEGIAKKTFKYYDYFDEIFGEELNTDIVTIYPILPDNVDENNEKKVEKSSVKALKMGKISDPKLSKYFERYIIMRNKRDAAELARHQELLEMQNRVHNAMNYKLQQLLNKIK